MYAYPMKENVFGVISSHLSQSIRRQRRPDATAVGALAAMATLSRQGRAVGRPVLVTPRLQSVVTKALVAMLRSSEIPDWLQITELLQHGADPNASGRGGLTVLILAAESNNLETVDIALRCGADPDITDSSGLRRTALWIAATLGYEEIVAKLLAANADPNIQGEEGNTPFNGVLLP